MQEAFYKDSSTFLKVSDVYFFLKNVSELNTCMQAHMQKIKGDA